MINNEFPEIYPCFPANSDRKIGQGEVIIRIHYISSCICNRIQKNIDSYEHKPSFVLEKTENYQGKFSATRIYCQNQSTIQESIQPLRNLLTTEIILKREIIFDYFKIYGLGVPYTEYLDNLEQNRLLEIGGLYISDHQESWNSQAARLVRDLTMQIPTITFCMSDPSRYLWPGYNGGCILISSREKLEYITWIFNNAVTPTEFTHLHVISLTELIKMRKNAEFCIREYTRCILKTVQYQNMYTIIGYSESLRRYKLSFGKREWFDKYIECSRQCAMRELFEEFNIQLSPQLLIQSRKWFQNQNICQIEYNERAVFYQVYIDSETSIHYDNYSETIRLGYD